MSDYPYFFTAKIEKRGKEKISSAVVYLPQKLVKQLPLEKLSRLRIEAEIEGVRHGGAFQKANGRWYLMMSKPTLKRCRLAVGEKANIEFEIADQDHVDVPKELAFAVEADLEIAAIWEKLTAGKRRSLAHYVSIAKRPETRERRVSESLQIIRDLGSVPKRGSSPISRENGVRGQ